MAQIEEDIYTEVYSSQARIQSETETNQTLADLDSRLQSWWAEHCGNTESLSDDDPLRMSPTTELAVMFYSTRMMLYWPVHEASEVYDRFLGDARTTMRHLIRLWKATARIGHYGMLAR